METSTLVQRRGEEEAQDRAFFLLFGSKSHAFFPILPVLQPASQPTNYWISFPCRRIYGQETFQSLMSEEFCILMAFAPWFVALQQACPFSWEYRTKWPLSAFSWSQAMTGKHKYSSLGEFLLCNFLVGWPWVRSLYSLPDIPFHLNFSINPISSESL